MPNTLCKKHDTIEILETFLIYSVNVMQIVLYKDVHNTFQYLIVLFNNFGTKLGQHPNIWVLKQNQFKTTSLYPYLGKPFRKYYQFSCLYNQLHN